MKYVNVICILLGVAALGSIIVYASTGAYWWVTVQQDEIERGLLLSLLHLISIILACAAAADTVDRLR